MRINRRFNPNRFLASACYIEDGNPNPGGAGGMPGGNEPTPQNNSGNPDPLVNFWDEPTAPAGQPTTPAPAAPAATPNDAPSGPFAEVKQMMETFKPPGFMNADIVNEMGQNKFDTFNQGLETHGKAVLEQSAHMMTGILKEIVPQLLSQVQSMMDSKFQTTDTSKFIADNFPESKDPRFAPQITRVFEQSLKHTKGDRTKAKEMTQQMLSAMGAQFAPTDPNAGNPPIPGGGRSKVNWFDELGVHLADEK